MSQEPVEVPAWVAELAGGAPVTPVWRNGLGGLTFRFGRGEEYLKVQRPGLDWDPDADLARLNWLKGIVPVPRVLASGEHEDQRWLLTAGLPGRTAVHRSWRERPEVIVPALGRALRRFHDSVPVSGCPFSWSVGYRVRRHGLAPAFLDRTPPVDAVVCHGDACNPNFLFADDGTLTGYVDLGRAGVTDRWADLAPALLSLTWNYGPGHEAKFLAGYGIADVPGKRRFYTALWEAES